MKKGHELIIPISTAVSFTGLVVWGSMVDTSTELPEVEIGEPVLTETYGVMMLPLNENPESAVLELETEQTNFARISIGKTALIDCDIKEIVTHSDSQEVRIDCVVYP